MEVTGSGLKCGLDLDLDWELEAEEDEDEGGEGCDPF